MNRLSSKTLIASALVAIPELDHAFLASGRVTYNGKEWLVTDRTFKAGGGDNVGWEYLGVEYPEGMDGWNPVDAPAEDIHRLVKHSEEALKSHGATVDKWMNTDW